MVLHKYNLNNKQDLVSTSFNQSPGSISFTAQMDSDLDEMSKAIGAEKQEHVSVSCVDLNALIKKWME